MSKKTINGQHNGYEFVEIAGTKWATCNVGAENPSDFGLYFQWGDRKGYTAYEAENVKVFNLDTYKHYNGIRFTKYNGFDKKRVLDLRDDPAFAYMGQWWRMPTQDEFRRLIESTTHMRVYNYQDSGISGMVFTDITDVTKELFFPAAGYCIDNEVYYVGQISTYWLNSCSSHDVLYAHRLYINCTYITCDSSNCRCFGYPVRGVLAD